MAAQMRFVGFTTKLARILAAIRRFLAVFSTV
jgi:hypothetical protein